MISRDLTINEWTAAQMLARARIGDANLPVTDHSLRTSPAAYPPFLQYSRGSYGFRHELQVPGLSEKATLLMNPSEVLNWLNWLPRSSRTVNGDFTCLLGF